MEGVDPKSFSEIANLTQDAVIPIKNISDIKRILADIVLDDDLEGADIETRIEVMEHKDKLKELLSQL